MERTVVVKPRTAQTREPSLHLGRRYFLLAFGIISISLAYLVGTRGTAFWNTFGNDGSVEEIEVGGLRCDSPVWDFGVVDLSTVSRKLSHKFQLTNISERTVAIKEIRSSCGCMVIGEYPQVLAPGESMPLQIGVDLPPRSGPFEKKLLIVIEDAGSPMILSVHGELTGISPLGTAPSSVNFGTLKVGETRERSIVLLRYGDVQMESLVVTSSDDWLTCKLTKGTESPRVQLTVDSTEMQPGSYSASVTIESRAAPIAKVVVPVAAVLQ